MHLQFVEADKLPYQEQMLLVIQLLMCGITIQSAPVAETPPVSPPPVAAEPPVKTILPVPKPVLVIPPVNPVKRYLIHVGNYSNPVKAAQVIDKLKQNNLKVSTEPSGNLTRIRVGPFTDREQADKARQLLQKQGTHTTLLILTR